jgi:sugar lactone lactonase YvrE
MQSTVGCVVPTSDPNILLAALGSNVVEVNVSEKKTGRIVAFVSTDDNAEGTRFNDGKATPQGVFIVGRMNRAWRDGQPGKLFAMDLRVPGNSFGLMTILGPTEVSHFIRVLNSCARSSAVFANITLHCFPMNGLLLLLCSN